MTTIALDATHIAWDSQITLGDEKVAYPAEKVWIVDRSVFAFAGDYGLLDPVIAWKRAGARAASAPDGSWQLLVVGRKGAVLYSDDVKFATPVKTPFAMGSGSAYARGAMLAGAAAYKAVQIACKCDVYSGGEVNVLELAPVWRARRARAAV